MSSLLFSSSTSLSFSDRNSEISIYRVKKEGQELMRDRSVQAGSAVDNDEGQSVSTGSSKDAHTYLCFRGESVIVGKYSAHPLVQQVASAR
jgi:hypothetical protein